MARRMTKAERMAEARRVRRAGLAVIGALFALPTAGGSLIFAIPWVVAVVRQRRGRGEARGLL